MTDDDPARARFARAALRSEEELDLGEAALHVATVAEPELDVRGWLGRLDGLAEEARPRLPDAHGLARLEALLGFLFGEVGLQGDRETYDDPENSYLHRVLERRRGIPISLSVFLVEVGRRLDLPLAGVGFPAHFIVRWGGEEERFVDAFDGGRLLDADGCRELLAAHTGGAIPFGRDLLRPAPKREVLARMLRNLKGSFARRGRTELALSCVERILLLEPERLSELRDRGLLHLEAGAYARAVADLDGYLGRAGEAGDAAEVKRRLAAARARLWEMN